MKINQNTTYKNSENEKIQEKPKEIKYDFDTLIHAINGEPDAIMKIVDSYQPYINKIAMKTVVSEFGETKTVVDETRKRPLETTLISAIMQFNI